MNERIEGLIHQMDRNGFPYQEDDCSMTVTHRDLEYFAELIIKEIVQGTLMRASWYDRKVDGRIVTMVSVVDLAKLIQKEFGVE